MRAYRVAWLGFCGVVGVAGALVAVTWSLSTVGLLFVLAALTGGMAAMIALTPADNTPFDRDRWPVVATSVVVAGAGAVAFVGLGTDRWRCSCWRWLSADRRTSYAAGSAG